MFKKLTLFLLITTLCFSCYNRETKHGYMFEDSKLKYLRKGISSKKEVLYIMGAPTIKNNKFDNSWIYLSQDVNNFLFFRPKITKREVLLVEFDGEDIIKDTKKIILTDNKNLDSYQKYTEVNGHKELGFIAAILSNIGTISPN